jgi:hypothetical protein
VKVEREYPEESDPGDVENEIKQSMKLQSMGLPTGSDASIKNMLQAVRARFGGSMDPDELDEIEQDLRDRLERSGEAQGNGAEPPLRGLA